MKRMLIYGSKSFGTTVRHLAAHCGYDFGGFIDDVDPSGEDVVGDFETVRRACSPDDHVIAVAIGYRHLPQRTALLAAVREASYQTPALVHPAAFVDPTAEVGEGSFIMSHCTVDINVTLGRGVVMWPGAVVCHDSRVGDNVFLSPNVTVCGCTAIGTEAFIGAAATIVDHQVVPDGSFVKAGAVHYQKSSS